MALLKTTIAAVIKQGVNFLESQQQNDGSFLSLSSADKKAFKNPLEYHALFSTALIFNAIVALPETKQIKKIKNKIANFLLTEKSKQWSFNYWLRTSQEAKTMPYPDDLDDTFCALSGLFRHGETVIDGEALGHIVQLLVATETQEGGPYRTWLVGETADTTWKDVDIAVNSNVAYFLSLQDISLPPLTKYIETCIATDKITSPYYPTVYPIIYFLSRFYKGKYKKKLQHLLLTAKGENPLERALIITSLLQLQTPTQLVTKHIVELLEEKKNNSWKAYAFYTDVSKKNIPYYGGSAALTTAICLEALARYLRVVDKIVQPQMETAEEHFYNQIINSVKQRLAIFDDIAQKRDKLLQKNAKKEIVLFPYFFAEAIGDKKKHIEKSFIQDLCLANVLGWIAYTIYDDFLDDEGDSQMLPLANVCFREVSAIFEKLLSKNTEFISFYHHLMDEIETANTWEVTHCRIQIRKGKADFKNAVLPDYKTYNHLAQKSLGHGLGPLAILFSLGYTQKSPEVVAILEFLRHYLIARQLHDDAHDWEKDLVKGHINAVGALLLQKMYKKELQGNEAVSLKKLLPKLQKLFWYFIVDDVCMLLISHINQARKAFKKCRLLIKDDSFFEQLLQTYEHAAQLTRNEKEKAIKFLHTYK